MNSDKLCAIDVSVKREQGIARIILLRTATTIPPCRLFKVKHSRTPKYPIQWRIELQAELMNGSEVKFIYGW